MDPTPVDLLALRLHLDMLVNAGQHLVTDSDQDRVGPPLRSLLERMQDIDKLAVLARCIYGDADSPELASLVRAGTEAARDAMPRVELILLGMPLLARQAILATVLLAMLPDAH